MKDHGTVILWKIRMKKKSHLLPGRHHVGHIPNHEGFSGLQPQDGGRVNSGVRAGNDHVLQPTQQIRLASTIQESIPNITKRTQTPQQQKYFHREQQCKD
jgi:hypothetical protein